MQGILKKGMWTLCKSKLVGYLRADGCGCDCKYPMEEWM